MKTKMKNYKLALSLLIIGIFTTSSTFSQDSQPHVPFSELDPSKGFANEAEYIKSHQELNNGTADPTTQINTEANTEIKAKNEKQVLRMRKNEYGIEEYTDGSGWNVVAIIADKDTPLDADGLAYFSSACENNKINHQQITELITNGLLTMEILNAQGIDPNSKLYQKVSDHQKTSK